LKQITQMVKIPAVAIGGISKNNIAEVVAAGADAVAVISAVLQAADPEIATRELVGLIEK
jgi:thiamine monophosphate synthase